MKRYHHGTNNSLLLAGIILLLLVFAGVLAASVRLSPQLGDTRGLARVSVAGTTIFVDVADTPEERSRGLSGTKELPKNRGMLFLFPRDGFYEFWMKDMTYPIDILWLSESGTVMHIEYSVSPDSYPDQIYSSPTPARSVLELPAGFAEEHGIEIGDHVTVFS